MHRQRAVKGLTDDLNQSLTLLPETPEEELSMFQEAPFPDEFNCHVPFGGTFSSIPSLPLDVFRFLFSFLPRTPGVLASVGLVRSDWHRAVLLSWGELLIGFRDHRVFPSALLQGLRILRVDRVDYAPEEESGEGEKSRSGDLFFADGSETEVVNALFFWGTIMSSPVCTKIVIGNFYPRPLPTLKNLRANLFHYSMSPMLPVVLISRLADRLGGMCFEGVQALEFFEDPPDLRLINEPCLLVTKCNIDMNQRDVEIVERTFPRIATLHVCNDQMLRTSCWRENVRDLNLDGVELQSPEAWGLLRASWPRLKRIVMKPIDICAPFGPQDRPEVLKSLLAGIRDHGIGKLEVLSLVISGTGKPRSGVCIALPLVDMLGVVENVVKLRLFLDSNHLRSGGSRCQFQQIEAFVRHVEGLVFDGGLLEVTEAMRAVRIRFFVASASYGRPICDDAETMLMNDLMSEMVSARLKVGKTMGLTFATRRSCFSRDPEALPPPGYRSPIHAHHCENAMKVTFTVDEDHEIAVLEMNLENGFGLDRTGVGQNILVASWPFYERVPEKRHLILLQDPFCGFATRTILRLLFENDSFKIFRLILKIQPSELNHVPSDLAFAWATPGKDVFEKFLLEIGFEIAGIGKMSENDLLLEYKRVGECRVNDLSLLAFYVQVVEFYKTAASHRLKSGEDCASVHKAYEFTLGCVGFLLELFQGHYLAPSTLKPIEPPKDSDFRILYPLKVALMLNLMLTSLKQGLYDLSVKYGLCLAQLRDCLTQPQEIRLFLRLGVVYERLRRFGKALQMYQEVLQLDSTNKRALLRTQAIQLKK